MITKQLDTVLTDVLDAKQTEWNQFFFPNQINEILHKLILQINQKDFFTEIDSIKTFLVFLKSYVDSELTNSDKESDNYDKEVLKQINKFLHSFKIKIFDQQEFDSHQINITTDFLNFLKIFIEAEHRHLLNEKLIKFEPVDLKKIAIKVAKNSSLNNIDSFVKEYISVLKLSFDVQIFWQDYQSAYQGITEIAKILVSKNETNINLMLRKLFSVLAYECQLIDYYEESFSLTSKKLWQTEILEAGVKLLSELDATLYIRKDISNEALKYYFYHAFQNAKLVDELKDKYADFLSDSHDKNFNPLPYAFECPSLEGGKFVIKHAGVDQHQLDIACQAKACADRNHAEWRKGMNTEQDLPNSHYTYHIFSDEVSFVRDIPRYTTYEDIGVGFYLRELRNKTHTIGNAYVPYSPDPYNWWTVSAHEYTHHLTFRAFGRVPRSFDEGLAYRIILGPCNDKGLQNWISLNRDNYTSLDLLSSPEFIDYNPSSLFASYFVDTQHVNFAKLLSLYPNDDPSIPAQLTQLIQQDKQDDSFLLWLDAYQKRCSNHIFKALGKGDNYCPDLLSQKESTRNLLTEITLNQQNDQPNIFPPSLETEIISSLPMATDKSAKFLDQQVIAHSDSHSESQPTLNENDKQKMPRKYIWGSKGWNEKNLPYSYYHTTPQQLNIGLYSTKELSDAALTKALQIIDETENNFHRLMAEKNWSFEQTEKKELHIVFFAKNNNSYNGNLTEFYGTPNYNPLSDTVVGHASTYHYNWIGENDEGRYAAIEVCFEGLPAPLGSVTDESQDIRVLPHEMGHIFQSSLTNGVRPPWEGLNEGFANTIAYLNDPCQNKVWSTIQSSISKALKHRSPSGDAFVIFMLETDPSTLMEMLSRWQETEPDWLYDKKKLPYREIKERNYTLEYQNKYQNSFKLWLRYMVNCCEEKRKECSTITTNIATLPDYLIAKKILELFWDEFPILFYFHIYNQYGRREATCILGNSYQDCLEHDKGRKMLLASIMEMSIYGDNCARDSQLGIASRNRAQIEDRLINSIQTQFKFKDLINFARYLDPDFVKNNFARYQLNAWLLANPAAREWSKAQREIRLLGQKGPMSAGECFDRRSNLRKNFLPQMSNEIRPFLFPFLQEAKRSNLSLKFYDQKNNRDVSCAILANPDCFNDSEAIKIFLSIISEMSIYGDNCGVNLGGELSIVPKEEKAKIEGRIITYIQQSTFKELMNFVKQIDATFFKDNIDRYQKDAWLYVNKSVRRWAKTQRETRLDANRCSDWRTDLAKEFPYQLSNQILLAPFAREANHSQFYFGSFGKKRCALNLTKDPGANNVRFPENYPSCLADKEEKKFLIPWVLEAHTYGDNCGKSQLFIASRESDQIEDRIIASIQTEFKFKDLIKYARQKGLHSAERKRYKKAESLYHNKPVRDWAKKQREIRILSGKLRMTEEECVQRRADLKQIAEASLMTNEVIETIPSVGSNSLVSNFNAVPNNRLDSSSLNGKRLSMKVSERVSELPGHESSMVQAWTLTGVITITSVLFVASFVHYRGGRALVSSIAAMVPLLPQRAEAAQPSTSSNEPETTALVACFSDFWQAPECAKSQLPMGMMGYCANKETELAWFKRHDSSFAHMIAPDPHKAGNVSQERLSFASNQLFFQHLDQCQQSIDLLTMNEVSSSKILEQFPMIPQLMKENEQEELSNHLKKEELNRFKLVRFKQEAGIIGFSYLGEQAILHTPLGDLFKRFGCAPDWHQQDTFYWLRRIIRALLPPYNPLSLQTGKTISAIALETALLRSSVQSRLLKLETAFFLHRSVQSRLLKEAYSTKSIIRFIADILQFGLSTSMCVVSLTNFLCGTFLPYPWSYRLALSFGALAMLFEFVDDLSSFFLAIGLLILPQIPLLLEHIGIPVTRGISDAFTKLGSFLSSYGFLLGVQEDQGRKDEQEDQGRVAAKEIALQEADSRVNLGKKGRIYNVINSTRGFFKSAESSHGFNNSSPDDTVFVNYRVS